MIGYPSSAYKIFWSFYSMFCTLLFFSYHGMLLVSLTPNTQLAAILASLSYTMLNFFSGYVIPKKVSFHNNAPSQCSTSQRGGFGCITKHHLTSSKKYFKLNSWLFLLHIAAHPKVVALAILSLSDVLGLKWDAHLTIWRCGQRNISFRRAQNCFCFYRGLLWVSAQLFGRCWCRAYHLSHCCCFSFCLFYW